MPKDKCSVNLGKSIEDHKIDLLVNLETFNRAIENLKKEDVETNFAVRKEIQHFESKIAGAVAELKLLEKVENLAGYGLDVSNARSVGDFFRTELDQLISLGEVEGRRAWSDFLQAFDKITIDGTPGSKFMKELITDPKFAQSQGLDESVIYRVMWGESVDKNRYGRELNIGNTWRDFNHNRVKSLSKKYPILAYRKNHTGVPVYPSPRVIQHKGKRALVDYFVKAVEEGHIDSDKSFGVVVGDKTLRQHITELVDEFNIDKGIDSGGTSKIGFQSRNLYFLNADAEFDFLRNWSSLNGNVFEAGGQHFSNLNKKIAIFSQYGPDPIKLLDDVFMKFEDVVSSKDNFLTERSKFLRDVEHEYKPPRVLNPNVASVGRIIRGVAGFALVRYRALRNFAFGDHNIVAVFNTLPYFTSRQGFLKPVMRKFGRTFQALVPKKREAMKELLQMYGVNTLESVKQLNKLMLNISDAELGNVNRILAQTERVVQRGNEIAMKLDLTQSAFLGSVFDVVNELASHWSMHFKHMEFDELGDAYKKLMSQYNIGKDEWAVLKSLPLKEFKVEDSILKRHLDIDHLGNLAETQPELFRSLRREGETSTQAAYRLQSNVRNMYTSWVEHTISQLNRRDRAKFSARDKGTSFDLITSATTQFMPIVDRHYINTMRSMRMMTNGASYREGDFSWKEKSAFAGMLTAYMASGMSILWMKDIMEGKELRDMTLSHNMLSAMQTSGLGGALATYLLSGIMYGKQDTLGPFGSVSNDIIAALKSGETRNILKLQRKIGIANLAYLQAAFNHTVMKEYGDFKPDMDAQYQKKNSIDIQDILDKFSD